MSQKLLAPARFPNFWAWGVAFAAGLVLGSGTAADRVALVVGCSHYQVKDLDLDSPGQDAKDLDVLLSTQLGFKVVSVLDPAIEDFYHALRIFKTQALNAKVALVYFAGRGLEHDGQNYLLAVNSTLDNEDQLETQAMNLERIIRDLGSTDAAVKLAVINCSRDNPFAIKKNWLKTKSTLGGQTLREPGAAEIPHATLVCLAATAGAASIDKQGHSLFTGYFLEELRTPGRSLRDVFENIHDKLKAATGGRQEPVLTSDNFLNEVFRRTVLLPQTTSVK